MFGETFVPGKPGGADTIGAFLGLAGIAALSTQYAYPYGSGVFAVAGQYPWPVGGTLSNMGLRIGAQPATGNLTATLTVNNVATALVITVPAGSPAGTYYAAGTLSIAAGDRLRWDIVNNATGISGALVGITMSIS